MIAKILKCPAIYLCVTLLLTACVGSNAGSGGGSINTMNVSSSAITPPINIKQVGTNNQINLSWTIDGENLNSLNNLHDMGWHLLKVTVTSVESSFVPANFGGVQAKILNYSPQFKQAATINDINCENAVFTGVGNSCNAYIKISYDYIHNTESYFPITVVLHPGNLNNYPYATLLNDDIQPYVGIGDYRTIDPIESQYYTGSVVTIDPKQYKILLMQNGSLESIAITQINLESNPAFVAKHRTVYGPFDPYYESWHECSLVENPIMEQDAQLDTLNKSCILIYKAESIVNIENIESNKTKESATINIGTNANQFFPANASNYLLQAKYLIVESWAQNGYTTGLTTTSAIAYGNSGFVAVGNSNQSAYSSDGESWLLGQLPSAQNWTSITYGNNAFVAVGGSESSTNVGAYSTDGIHWGSMILPSSQYWSSVACGNGIFVAIGQSDVGAYSTDEVHWQSMNLPSSQYWSSIAYGHSMFVAVSGSGSSYSGSNAGAYSTDGINWQSTYLPSSQYWSSVAYGNGVFVAISTNSKIGAYSTDGINWQPVTFPSNLYFVTSIGYGDGRFVVISNNGGAYSTDGIHWTVIPISYQAWAAIAYGENEFMAVANNSSVATYTRQPNLWLLTKFEMLSY